MVNILTGYGKPSVLLPGFKGQIYVDQLTGDEYECKGERGFIRVDGDDQDNQFNWVLKKPEKPFYEKVLTSVAFPIPPEISDIPEDFWYKVSDNIPTGDVSVGTKCTVFIDDTGFPKEIVIAETDYYISSEGLVVVVLKDNTTVPGFDVVFPKKGTYFLAGPGMSGITIIGFSIGDTSVPEITWDGQTTKLKKLDEKFIPSRIIGIINSDLTFTADPSFDPSTMSVSDALASGKDLLYMAYSDGTTLKCICWKTYDDGTVIKIGFYNLENGADITLEWTTLVDGTVSIKAVAIPPIVDAGPKIQ